jgi:hypothetical protein
VLVARLFQEQVLVCPRYAGPRTIVAAITDLEVADRILDHLGLPGLLGRAGDPGCSASASSPPA